VVVCEDALGGEEAGTGFVEGVRQIGEVGGVGGGQGSVAAGEGVVDWGSGGGCKSEEGEDDCGGWEREMHVDCSV
jgi:hypothetical protein